MESGKIDFTCGKAQMIKDGVFDDIDATIMQHTTICNDDYTAGATSGNHGFVGKLIKYTGKPSHAGAAPWDGINALNAAILGLMGVNLQRETFKDEDRIRIHPIITKGGDIVNVVPADVRLESYVRGASPRAILDASAKMDRALKAGADFDALAKKYGQTGEKSWLTTREYQLAPTMDADTKSFLNQLNTMAANELRNIGLSQGNIIVQVVDRKNFITKYTAAVVKKTIDFSKDTYSTAYNKFSSFVSANQKGEDLVNNAQKNGYQVQTRNDITTAEHYLANIRGTRDALKWLFEAKEGEISPMYECGDNNHLLVVVLDKIHKVGNRSLEDPQVKEFVKSEVIRDKKAAQLMEKAQGIKSIADAKAKGAVVDSVSQITFAAPVFIASSGASEPALSGAVAGTAKGAFSKAPVKGNEGVYLFQVTDRHSHAEAFNAKQEEMKLRQRVMQYASGFMGELYQKAKVSDNRYLFF